MPEKFQPIAVRSPQTGRFAFALRCMVDLQLKTIAYYLKPALSQIRGSVLDVGAGASPWRDWLTGVSQYQALDIESAHEFGMPTNTASIIYYDGRIMPLPSNQYDAAICVEVLEHAQEPKLLISEIHRVLKEDGKLLLTIPWSARRHHIPNDYQRFTREGLERLISLQGFKDIKILDRGNEISVIANKLTILTITLATSGSLFQRLIKLPAAIACAPIAFIFIIIAHLSNNNSGNTTEDPLGYFLTAKKSSSSQTALACENKS